VVSTFNALSSSPKNVKQIVQYKGPIKPQVTAGSMNKKKAKLFIPLKGLSYEIDFENVDEN
jgi:hypothetical protein